MGSTFKSYFQMCFFFSLTLPLWSDPLKGRQSSTSSYPPLALSLPRSPTNISDVNSTRKESLNFFDVQL